MSGGGCGQTARDVTAAVTVDRRARHAPLAPGRPRSDASWGTSDLFSAVQRAVLAYTDCLVLDGGRTPDGVFAALQPHLSDEEILEFNYITALTCTR